MQNCTIRQKINKLNATQTCLTFYFNVGSTEFEFQTVFECVRICDTVEKCEIFHKSGVFTSNMSIFNDILGKINELTNGLTDGINDDLQVQTGTTAKTWWLCEFI